MRTYKDGFQARLEALYESALDNIECLEVAMSELGFGFDYVVEEYYKH